MVGNDQTGNDSNEEEVNERQEHLSSNTTHRPLFVEHFPMLGREKAAGHVWGIDEEKRAEYVQYTERLRNATEQNDSDFSPFDSEADFQLARFLKTYRLSRDAADELLQILNVCIQGYNSYVLQTYNLFRMIII